MSYALAEGSSHPNVVFSPCYSWLYSLSIKFQRKILTNAHPPPKKKKGISYPMIPWLMVDVISLFGGMIS